MRVIESAIERVWSKIAQIFFVQLTESGDEWSAVVHGAAGVFIGLIFEAAADAMGEW